MRENETDNPLIVLVVISWNGIRETLTCLTNLRRLTYQHRKVVLVDNGSRDGTVRAVRRYFPEVDLIANTQNLGYVRGTNQGIRWALENQAEWILLLNNDVELAPTALDELITVGQTAPDCGIVGPVMQRTLRPDIEDLGGDLDFCWGRVLLRRLQQERVGPDWQPIDYVWGCALMAHRQVFEEVGLFDPRYIAYFEDADLCLRAKRRGYQTVVALRAKITHQVGRSGEKRFLWQTALRMRNHLLFFLRNAPHRCWLTLLPSLMLFQLPMLLARSMRVYLARKLNHKYADRRITLWGHAKSVLPADETEIKGWLREAGYPARR